MFLKQLQFFDERVWICTCKLQEKYTIMFKNSQSIRGNYKNRE
jgi:hypothetical protein